MAIATSTGGAGGAPFAKFNRLGDKLEGAFGSDPMKSKRQRRNYKTGAPVVRPGKDGEDVPVLEEIMHFIAMPGTSARTGTAETEFVDIEPGAHVRYSVSGFEWGQVIDERKKLPAYAGFKASQPCSGDVYTIELIGWSTHTENPNAAQRAGFTVVENRIIMATDEEREKYILAQARSGGSATTGKDMRITIRRPNPDEKRWEQLADELFLSKPWEKQTVAAGGDAGPFADEESF